MELGVYGWVRNCPDGRVEALIEGEAANVARMVEWCHMGPPQARVADVQTVWEEYRAEFNRFSIR
jgi:acylphosphatase